MNNLEVISKLALEAVAEGKRKDTQVELLHCENLKLKVKHDDLLADYDQLHSDCELAESNAELARAVSKSLIKESSEKDAAIESIESVNALLSSRDELLQAENDRLRKVERENQVLRNDNKKLVDQVKRHQQAKPKKVKPVKIGAGVARLTEENKRLNQYISELLKWGQVSPQYLDSFTHSKQGRLDIIDLKVEESDVSEVGGLDPRVKECQRFIVVNKYNSIKMLTAVKGEDGIHKPKAPKGWTVQIDDEVLEHITKYSKKAETVNKQINAHIKAS